MSRSGNSGFVTAAAAVLLMLLLFRLPFCGGKNFLSSSSSSVGRGRLPRWPRSGRRCKAAAPKWNGSRRGWHEKQPLSGLEAQEEEYHRPWWEHGWPRRSRGSTPTVVLAEGGGEWAGAALPTNAQGARQVAVAYPFRAFLQRRGAPLRLPAGPSPLELASSSAALLRPTPRGPEIPLRPPRRPPPTR